MGGGDGSSQLFVADAHNYTMQDNKMLYDYDGHCHTLVDSSQSQVNAQVNCRVFHI